MADRNLAIITGGSRGIGHVLVQSLLEDMDVLNISRGPAQAVAPSSGHVLHNLSMDLQDVDRIERVLGDWFGEHPEHRVPIVIHNAAILNLGWLHELSAAEVQQAFQVNVHAPLRITTSVLKLGRFSRTECRVAYVVSSLGRFESGLSFAGMGLYSVTKAALGRLALIQAREFEFTAPNVKVLRIHPGIVDTEMQDALRREPRLDPAFAKKTAALPPYREGDWDERSSEEHPRTVSPTFSAEFILWATRSPKVDSQGEYDFYRSTEFHAARRRGRMAAATGRGRETA
jgi:NAD(P)-dependent dehydrogenase (short-subunit alcohol dehydrogenase family)